MMQDVALAGFLSLGVTAAVAPLLIRWLRKMKIGQKILEIGPKWHLNKQNIPTMGGITFIVGIFAAMGLTVLLTKTAPSLSQVFAILGFALANGFIGMYDDYRKIKKQRNLGLTALQKFLLQLAVAIVFISLLRWFGAITPRLIIPFLNVVINMPWIVYMAFMAFVIVATVNAVNITDGLDGLAAGVTLPVGLFFLFAALYLEKTLSLPTLRPVAQLAAALAGGMAGFLIYNFNPARVFMGDTGSLFLGALVCGLAFAVNLPVILIPVGFVYVVETLSDIIQVGYFKLSGGKRVFKMAPIHHHFELCGYTERQIVITAFLITTALCLLSYWGVMRLYG